LRKEIEERLLNFASKYLLIAYPLLSQQTMRSKAKRDIEVA
jgi:hypothetical protein